MGFEFPLFILFGSLQVDGAVHIGLEQHALQRLDDLGYFFIRLPLFLSHHFLADVAVLHIRVPYHGFELEHWEFEGELFGEVEINNQVVAFVGGAGGALDRYFPVEQILFLPHCDLSVYNDRYSGSMLPTPANSFSNLFISPSIL